ncbi:TIGR02444 family protein [Halomonas kenyensis]|uniref:TIGR02444 family protein n=2 Tax=Billgrantia kenyensis TaxID=321266 RepID=A0A7V9W2B8_9GAMM|nr:TIGR02444 family protein [Halomonas kenyensis]MCG6662179.1 TIGR02444 family protein [Halomonas kenyensis]
MSDDSTATRADLRSRLAADPLWDFALDFYGRPGVEAACLLLQDEAGVDVCELLWRCWLHRHGLAPAGEPAELAAIRRWQDEVTVPLRALRRRLKAQSMHDAGTAKVRRVIQQAELAAERETLLRLQHLAEHTNPSTILTRAASNFENSLASRWKLQKKAQLLALQTLECQLDPL